MKKTTLLLLLTIAVFQTLLAQPNKKMVDETLASKKIAADTSKKGSWKKGGTIAINLNQQNSSNWVGASESYAFSLGAGADLYANMEKKKNTWDNTLKMNYAFIKNSSLGARKTTDFIDLFSKYGRTLNDSGTLAFATIFNGRTQFTNGYDYSLTPKRRTSGFFAPASILLTPGLDWRPCKHFSLFFSPAAAKWIIVSNDPYSYSIPGGGGTQKPIAELYGVDPAKKVDFQFGAFLTAQFNKEVLKNVVYSSRLDLYSNYLHEPGNIDLFWTNNLLFKVNKWLGITYQWNVAYDHDYQPTEGKGPEIQFLGNFGIGVTGKF